MDTKNILVEPYEHIIIFEEEKYKKERKKERSRGGGEKWFYFMWSSLVWLSLSNFISVDLHMALDHRHFNEHLPFCQMKGSIR